jgi:hypothetical protein
MPERPVLGINTVICIKYTKVNVKEVVISIKYDVDSFVLVARNEIKVVAP